MESDKLIRYEYDKTFVFIDFETLNLCLNFCHNLPWQLAMIKIKGKRVEDKKDFLIKWDTHLKISEEAARITRYSQDAVNERGSAPREVFDAMREWLEPCDYIVGHNILGFDLYLIKEYYKLYGLPYQHLVNKVIDTNSLAKGLKLNKKYTPDQDFIEYQYLLSNKRAKGVKTNLRALGKEFHIEHDYDKLHNALVDLELNIKVWDKLKIELDI
jgi:DNA polymerase III epsilon subunit-like protein